MNAGENGYKLLRNMIIVIMTIAITNIPISIWWASAQNTEMIHVKAEIVELKKKIDGLNDTVKDNAEKVDNMVNAKMDDRYRAKDARVDFEKRDIKIEKNSTRLYSLEKEIAK